MESKVQQLKLFLESIEEYDPKLISKIDEVVDVIFEAEDNEDKNMEAAMKLISGGFADLPQAVQKKALEKRNLTDADMKKAMKAWEAKYGKEDVIKEQAKKLSSKG